MTTSIVTNFPPFLVANSLNNLRYTNADTAVPLVVASRGGRGVSLVSLQSEHLSRRIAATQDFQSNDPSALELYNEGLGEGKLPPLLDSTYIEEEVEKLGYGLDKYLALRVGPFPDVYDRLCASHAEVTTRLIAAEAANGKFVGWGRSFRM